ncbi:hypothetical protein I79_018979 [Cricetulus griseus]|uniref:Uncharacterized protein n=1 Tax=Cricetulus griseus TaxID=10029 RepID=G3I667_CRIGR|nr:hypothetical protein I79_018979 [Cricetulus griseus]
MDFLSHPNSTVQRSSPQSGGIPPASDAAAPPPPRPGPGWARPTAQVRGGSRHPKTPRQGQKLTRSQ